MLFSMAILAALECQRVRLDSPGYTVVRKRLAVTRFLHLPASGASEDSMERMRMRHNRSLGRLKTTR